MNLYHLEYFLTLAETQHYTKAAERLYITQPSLSYAISSLEKELGLKLFEKDGRNVVLTPAGEIFADKISGGVSSIHATLKSMNAIRQGSGPIRIGSVRVLTRGFVPNIAEAFRKKNPGLQIQYTFDTYTGLSRDIVDGVKNKSADVAFTSYVENEPGLIFHPVYEQQLVIIVPKEHELAKYDELEMRQLREYPIVTFSRKTGLWRTILELFENAGIVPKIAYSVFEDETVAGLVAANFGIGIVPYMYVLKYLPVKIIRIKNPGTRRFFYLSYLKNPHRLPIVNKFIDFVLENYMAEENISRADFEQKASG